MQRKHMNYRHELKHFISYMDMLILRQRLGQILKPDDNGIDGKYIVRSLYFDTPHDTALREKLDGVSKREKFRLRYYNKDTSFILLEKKSKYQGLGNKQKEIISLEQVGAILGGNLKWLRQSQSSLLQELYSKMMFCGFEPKTIVDYTREAFIYQHGNVRITLDSNIRTALNPNLFLNPQRPTIPIGSSPIILEIKWDEYLPDIIRDLIQLKGVRTTSFSKYAQCRIYD